MFRESSQTGGKFIAGRTIFSYPQSMWITLWMRWVRGREETVGGGAGTPWSIFDQRFLPP
jgi:hypothetical protein